MSKWDPATLINETHLLGKVGVRSKDLEKDGSVGSTLAMDYEYFLRELTREQYVLQKPEAGCDEGTKGRGEAPVGLCCLIWLVICGKSTSNNN